MKKIDQAILEHLTEEEFTKLKLREGNVIKYNIKLIMALQLAESYLEGANAELIDCENIKVGAVMKNITRISDVNKIRKAYRSSVNKIESDEVAFKAIKRKLTKGLCSNESMLEHLHDLIDRMFEAAVTVEGTEVYINTGNISIDD